ncbi:hypothetical protein P0Y35_05870 [Kiritimatiellaeota bacterium B1221]|nr:hypothetical protein [Kiritimatiellaeota bacterium B1221]
MTQQNKDFTRDPNADLKAKSYADDPRVAKANKQVEEHRKKREEEKAEYDRVKEIVKKEILAEQKEERFQALKKLVRPDALKELKDAGEIGPYC